MIRYQAKIYKDGERFSVEFPDLPGCFSDGKNKEEAKKNAREALSLYLEEARDPQCAIPKAKNRRGKDYEWITPHEDVAIPLMIRHARLKHGLSQQRLAVLLGMSVQQLQKLEMPVKSNPTVKTLVLISETLHEVLEINLAA
jgi:predicted RNase H-like HicB family nuclease/DNA-binding XRE family transcriptional regulator